MPITSSFHSAQVQEIVRITAEAMVDGDLQALTAQLANGNQVAALPGQSPVSGASTGPVRAVSAGLRPPSAYVAGDVQRHRYVRLRRRAMVDMSGQISILFPTYYRARPGAYVLDVDFPDSFNFACAIEPVFSKAATGLDPADRIQGVGADGLRVQSYAPGVGPFAYIEFFFDLPDPVKKGQEFGIWYVIENVSQANGPFNMPTGAQGVGSPLFASFEATGSSAQSFTGSDFLGTATEVAALNTSAARYMPCAILAAVPANQESWLVIGDSIPEGSYDNDLDARGSRDALMGYADRLIAGKWQFPVANLSKGSDRWNYMGPNADAIPRTVAVMSRCNPTHIHSQIGTNDLAGGRTAAQMVTDAALSIAKWKSACPDARIVGGTIIPQSSSSDNWATVHNQTPAFPPIARRGAGNHRGVWNNTHVRGLSSALGLDDFIELGHIENDPVNHDSLWRALDGITALPYCANDGTHPKTAGSIFMAENAVLGGQQALRPQPGLALIGKFSKADFNSTADQRIYLDPTITRCRITRIVVVGASVSLTTAAGGVYTAAAKGGTALVAAAQAYASLTTPAKVLELTMQNNADALTTTSVFLSLTTAQGAAATADVYIYGEVLN